MTPTTTPPTLLILAAGMGSRYGGLKQLDPVGPGGETLMDYSVFDAVRAGFGKLVFVIRRDFEAAFQQNVGARFAGRLPVEYVFQELAALPEGFSLPPQRTRPWGTGHAVLAAASAIHEPFAAINADDFYGANSFRILAEHLQSGGRDNAMVGFILRQTLSKHGSVARGVCRTDAEGFLQSVVEIVGIEPDGGGAKYPDATGATQRFTGDEPVSLNMWGFTPALFPELRRQFAEFLAAHGQDAKAEFYIPAVVNQLIQNGRQRCRVLRTPDAWCGVTYQADRPRVTEHLQTLIARGDYPERLWA